MAIEIQASQSKVPKKDTKKRQFSFSGTKKITASERMFFIEQLALLLETGSDLHSSLNILKQQSKNLELTRVLTELSDDISEGRTFSASLAKHPEVFSTTYIGLIAASENGGYLQRILEHLVEMEKQRDELHTTLVSAMSYPAFLMFFSVAMVIFILVVVFPKFADMFVSIHDQLPATTIFLMDASHIIINYWWALLAGLVSLIMGFIYWVNSDSGNKTLSAFKLKVPLLKHVFIKLYLIQAMRVLGLSLKHGVNLMEALDIAKGVVKNYVFQEFITGLCNDINEGRKLEVGFNKAEFIPPMVKQMIATGEETGNLALVSTRIADFFQKDLEKLLKFITKAIEPVMLIVMGVVVGVLVSSLILPIFKLSHAVH